MKKNTEKLSGLAAKLSAYSTVAAGAVAMANPANAGVIYNDYAPDTVITPASGFVTVDVNQDGIEDFAFAIYTGTYAGQAYAAAYAVSGSYGGYNGIVGNITAVGPYNFVTPSPLVSGSTVNSGSAFNDSSTHVLGFVIGTQNLAGNFASQSCRYLGVHFTAADGEHYGWILLDSDLNPANPSITIKGMAYDDTPATGLTIVAPVTPVTNLAANITGTAGNGSDVSYSFDAGCSDAAATEHRVIVVKASAAASFDLTAAGTVTSGNYLSITPNGGPYSGSFTSGTTDSDGDVLAQGTPYDLFVYSTGNNDVLTTGVPFIIPVALTDSASNLVLADIADNADGRDLQLSFDKGADETYIDEYSIVLLKSAQADTASLAFLGSLPSTAYTSVTPNGSNQSVTFLQSTVDADGDPITFGVAYKAIVGTIGSSATGGAVKVTGPSNEITLNAALMPDSATNIVAADIADNGDGRDLQLTFDKAADETNVDVYAVAVLPSAMADTATLAFLNTLPMGNFTTVSPNGSNQTVNFTAASVDVNGDPITYNVAYKALVATVGTAATGDLVRLSGPSNEVTLNEPVGIEKVELLEGVELFSNNAKVNVTVRNEAVAGETLHIVSLTGQEVYTGTVELGTKAIDLSNVNTGIYVAFIQHNGQVMRQKLFIGK